MHIFHAAATDQVNAIMSMITPLSLESVVKRYHVIIIQHPLAETAEEIPKGVVSPGPLPINSSSSSTAVEPE